MKTHWLTALVLLIGSSLAQAETEYLLTISNHRFEPAELHVPANTKVKLRVVNRDSTPEEFESYELHREKRIAGGAEISVFVGPLSPGRYAFFGEYHEDTAQGVLVVDAP